MRRSTETSLLAPLIGVAIVAVTAFIAAFVVWSGEIDRGALGAQGGGLFGPLLFAVDGLGRLDGGLGFELGEDGLFRGGGGGLPVGEAGIFQLLHVAFERGDKCTAADEARRAPAI